MSCDYTTPSPTLKPINRVIFKKMDDILDRARCNGSLIISGVGGAGKTIASMWLVRRIMDSQAYLANEERIIIYDPILNYRYNFDHIPYINLKKTSIIPYEPALIMDMYELTVREKQATFLSSVLTEFKNAKQRKVDNNGVNPYTQWLVGDELHNILGRYALTGKSGDDMREFVTTGRNFAEVIIGITRRLSDLATTLVESSNTFLMGATSGENDLNKIEAMTNVIVRNRVAKLKRKSFVFYDKENDVRSEIKFPTFQQLIDQKTGEVLKPYEYNIDDSEAYVIDF